MQNQNIRKILESIHNRPVLGEAPTIEQSYDQHAAMVVKPGNVVVGHKAISAAMSDSLSSQQIQQLNKGDSVLIESDDVALLLAKTYTRPVGSGDFESPQRSIYVFKKSQNGQWKCVVDNYFGTDLLDFV